MEDDVGAIIESSTEGSDRNCLESREWRGRAGAGTSERGKERAVSGEGEGKREQGKKREREERTAVATHGEGKREQEAEEKGRKCFGFAASRCGALNPRKDMEAIKQEIFILIIATATRTRWYRKAVAKNASQKKTLCQARSIDPGEKFLRGK
ncbi:hypothetical protein MRB53_023870 [Persea americana]|uniref:Uncharacterized protein n=1 Tax=Persea americana TaxID=3435 RepID=A0ACC2LAZ0_PERAE|nr:hypothetical protein MRB53_023870 [Persea americana]